MVTPRYCAFQPAWNVPDAVKPKHFMRSRRLLCAAIRPFHFAYPPLAQMGECYEMKGDPMEALCCEFTLRPELLFTASRPALLHEPRVRSPLEVTRVMHLPVPLFPYICIPLISLFLPRLSRSA